MIKERYVNFEVATLLRNKGFNEACRGVYEEKVLRINTLCDWFNSDFSEYVAAPTQQMACDWIEENYKIHIVLLITKKGYVASICDISDLDNLIYMVDTKYYPDIESVYNEALEYILTNMI